MPQLALAVSLFVLSQSALLVRLAKEASPLEVGLWRMVVAVPIIFLVGALQGKLQEFSRIRAKQMLALFGCGLCLFCHWYCWFKAVQLTALANSMVFFAVSPATTAIGAWIFFREPFERRHGIAMFFCVVGVVLIVRDSLSFEPAHLPGDALSLLASVLFSCYVLIGKGIRREMGNIPFTVITYTGCGILFALLLLAQGKIRTDYSSHTWMFLGLLALGPTVLGHSLFTYCLEYFNVNLMNILILTEPLLGAATAYVVLGEPFKPGVIVGFLVICVGIFALFLPGLVNSRQAK